MKPALTCSLGTLTLVLASCAAPPTQAQTKPGEPDSKATTSSVGVMWGQRVGWADLGPSLAELAGRTALEELALDRGLRRRLDRAGLVVTREMIDQERARMVASLGTEGDAVARFRRVRGLGPARFEGLLRRNASLRALVGEVEADDLEVRRLHELRHGSRRVCRVLIAGSASEAASIRERLWGLEGEALEWAFARAAFEHSIDPSASAGGYLGAIHPLDPSLPTALREALTGLPDHELSPVVLAEGGAVLLLPTETRPGSGRTLETTRVEIEPEAQARAQRLAMDDLAREILREAGLTVLDESLEWARQNGGR